MAAVKAHERVATYWHMLPEAAQARKAIWEAVNPHTGKRRIDEAFHPKLRALTREQEMYIKFSNGSTWQVVGSDNYDSLVGSPPAGVVFSEYALANPSAWNMLRPILAENKGWAAFISTPRGPNHLEDLYTMAKRDDGWFAELLTADHTGVIDQETLRQERKELMANHGAHGEAIFQQEYYCSFQAAIIGAFYGQEMEAVEKEKRIVKNLYDEALTVGTAWDLGMSDHTVIWFYQQDGFSVRLIDYYAASGFGLDHYAGILHARGYSPGNPKGYKYGRHILPHDTVARDMSTGKTRVDTLRGLGVDPYICPKIRDEDYINAARRMFPKCWFDQDKTAEGRKALKQYRREWDDERKVFYDRARHDWASHPADAFSYLAVGIDELAGRRLGKRRPHETTRDMSWVV